MYFITVYKFYPNKCNHKCIILHLKYHFLLKIVLNSLTFDVLIYLNTHFYLIKLILTRARPCVYRPVQQMSYCVHWSVLVLNSS